MVARMIEMSSLRVTIRQFMKQTIKKSPASQFSYKGLGEKRKKMKRSSMDHEIYHFLSRKFLLENCFLNICVIGTSLRNFDMGLCYLILMLST